MEASRGREHLRGYLCKFTTAAALQQLSFATGMHYLPGGFIPAMQDSQVDWNAPRPCLHNTKAAFKVSRLVAADDLDCLPARKTPRSTEWRRHLYLLVLAGWQSALWDLLNGISDAGTTVPITIASLSARLIASASLEQY